MMTYAIWNPFIESNDRRVLKCALTYAALGPGIGNQSRFVQGIVDDIGLEAKVMKWDLLPYRTHYYTDYVKSEYWQGRWAVVWKLRAELNHEINNFEQDDLFSWYETSVLVYEDRDEPKNQKDIPCLVISDFLTLESLMIAKRAIEEDEKSVNFQSYYEVAKPWVEQQLILGRFHQLQVVLGGFDSEFYEAGADYASHIMQLCQNAGGSTHYSKYSM